MSDPLQPVQPGQFSPAFRAATMNAVIESARAYRAGRRGNLGGSALDDFFTGSVLAEFVYTADAEERLDAFSVIAYGDPFYDPSDDAKRFDASRSPTFELAVPSSASAPFAVTVAPIQGQTFGRAIVSGLAVVQVSVTDAAHTRAVPVAATTANLASATSGGVPIVWMESGTGTKWAIVLMGDPDPLQGGLELRSLTAAGTNDDGLASQIGLTTGYTICTLDPGGSAASSTLTGLSGKVLLGTTGSVVPSSTTAAQCTFGFGVWDSSVGTYLTSTNTVFLNRMFAKGADGVYMPFGLTCAVDLDYMATLLSAASVKVALVYKAITGSSPSNIYCSQLWTSPIGATY